MRIRELVAGIVCLWMAAPAGALPIDGACTRTSQAARAACGHEAEDDFWIARGICANLADEGASKACRASARESRGEMRAECREQFAAREELCDALGQAPYDPAIDPASFLSPAATDANPNPYFPLVPGATWVYQKPGETITVTVTNETKEILGVTTMVVTDLVVDDGGELIEDTRDYFAQHADGTVWYFGELVKNFENGELANVDGSFVAGIDGAKPGIIMEAAPAVGDVYRQEFALANAEDAAEVLSTTGTESVPAASCSGNCLVTRDFTPLSPDAEENKYYAPGIGFILEIEPETGERLELVSVTGL
ncbi:MAG: hypothetical protein ACREQ9_01385 [Candidatus Binatia bacterium]